MSAPLIAVVGMAPEARRLRHAGAEIIIGGGQGRRLAAELERALSAGATGILTFGLCGGLDPASRVGEVIVATEVVADEGRFPVDQAWGARLAASIPKVRRGAIAAADQMIAEASAKAARFAASGALAADMESHVAARAAAARGIPLAVVRAVSDAADRTLPPAARVGLGADGRADVAAVLRAVIRDPRQIGSLIGVARDAGRALSALARAAEAAGPGFRLRLENPP